MTELHFDAHFEPDHAGIFNALVAGIASQSSTLYDQLREFCDKMALSEDERNALYADVLRSQVDNA